MSPCRHAVCVPRSIEIAATTAEACLMNADAFVVIDCLRATTTIAALFHGGLRRLWAAAEIADARACAKRERALLFGEVGGLPPDDFDYGNSPVEAARAPVRGMDGVLFTTNGTTALTALANRGVVYAGAPVNTGAILASLAQHERVVLACAGEARGTRFALEDFAAAAFIAQRATSLWPDAQLGDLALLGLTVGEPLSLIPRSRHADVTRRLGFSRDIAFAMQVDTCPVAPRVTATQGGMALLAV